MTASDPPDREAAAGRALAKLARWRDFHAALGTIARLNPDEGAKADRKSVV